MRPVYVKESNMTIMSHSVFNCACKRVSLTVLTSRCVWENRASGEHGGPCLKLDTVVGADSLFSVVICSKTSHPPHSLTFCLFTFCRDSSLLWTCVSCHPASQNCCMDISHTSSEAVIQKMTSPKSQTVLERIWDFYEH